MKLSLYIIAATLLIAQNAFAGASVEKKLFTMEKNYNAENIMVISTQTDDNCKFLSKNNEYLEFYWMMDRSTRKEVHPTILKQIKEKIKFSGINSQRDSFKVQMNDLSELKHDLEEASMEVSSGIENGVCAVKSVIKLGPSASYRKLNLKRTYCDVTTNMIGIPNGCKFIDLDGNDADTNIKLKVRFYSK
ncbi:MAG: hypothetical protein WC635_01415 [Bacteriovorax sp.]|jgi:hypothetical protein